MRMRVASIDWCASRNTTSVIPRDFLESVMDDGLFFRLRCLRIGYPNPYATFGAYDALLLQRLKHLAAAGLRLESVLSSQAAR